MREKTDHVLERMVFFSDAVFAIAITLLVIEIHVPDLPHGASDAQYLAALHELIPSFAGYIISFAIVAAFWAVHHRAFALAERYHQRVLLLNMLLLGMVAFVPFASAFISHNMGDRVPSVFYCATLAVTAALNAGVVWIATGPEMASANAAGADRWAVRSRSLGLLLGSATAVAVTFVAPLYGQFALVTTRIWQRLLASRKVAD